MATTLQAFLERLIPATLNNLQREYPHGLLHQFQEPADLALPTQLHPTFYGCYDWHSAVHSHWQVVRALRVYPDAPFADAALAVLERSFAPANLASELAYLQRYPSFEMPYGIAWLLQLVAELREWASPQSEQWLEHLAPLERLAAQRFQRYIMRLPYPIRSGVHNQSAFAMALVLDWARTVDDAELAATIAQQAQNFFATDRNAPLAYEPSGTDFLSPALAEADLLRRIWGQAEFATWLWQFWGTDAVDLLPRSLQPLAVVDYSDGQLAHFTGLNLSRAWMLEGIANHLLHTDPLRPVLLDLAQRHRSAGLADAEHPDYMVSHWTPSFALYLLTERGLIGV